MEQRNPNFSLQQPDHHYKPMTLTLSKPPILKATKTRLPKLTQRYAQARVYATQLHATQTRKGGIPFINHLLAVSTLVLENGGNEDQAIAALLHDAVEDQGGAATLAVIQQKFGDRVAAIVASCTESDIQPKPPWRDRKERYIEQMRQASAEVHLVSLADKLDNLRSTHALLQQEGITAWQRFKGDRNQSVWFYQELLKIYQTTHTGFMIAEYTHLLQAIGS